MIHSLHIHHFSYHFGLHHLFNMELLVMDKALVYNTTIVIGKAISHHVFRNIKSFFMRLC